MAAAAASSSIHAKRLARMLSGADARPVAQATAFADFEGVCLSSATASDLSARIAALEARHCTVDTSPIVAKPIAVSVGPAGCKDNDAGIMGMIGQNCKQVTAHAGALWRPHCRAGHSRRWASACGEDPCAPHQHPHQPASGYAARVRMPR